MNFEEESVQRMVYYIGIRLDRRRKTTRYFNQDILYAGKDLNHVPSEHKSRTLSLRYETRDWVSLRGAKILWNSASEFLVGHGVYESYSCPLVRFGEVHSPISSRYRFAIFLPTINQDLGINALISRKTIFDTWPSKFLSFSSLFSCAYFLPIQFLLNQLHWHRYTLC